MKFVSNLLVMGVAIALVSCGQDPAFSDQSQGFLPSGSNAQTGDGPATVSGSGSGSSGDAVAQTTGNQQVQVPGGGSSLPWMPGTPSTPSTPSTPAVPNTPAVPTVPMGPTTPNHPLPPSFHTNPADPMSPVFTVPDATTAEVDQISTCLQKWGQVPFSGAVSVRRIYAAVTVGGFGVAVNDVTQTSGPALILVDAGVNVGGAPVYNMLNNNGYYCMKVNVNVNTAFTVNLACQAHLADNSVQVNVGSSVGGTTSAIGVNVNSNVTVHSRTPGGAACY